jgi:hypothetical protein
MGIKETVDALAKSAGAVPAVDRTQRTLTDGSPETPDHRELRSDGMQKGYVVLSDTERARGFVRPVRRSYVHVGKAPKNPLRDLTAEERERYGKFNYAKYETYPESRSPVLGRYWTQAELDRQGCGVKTTMGLSIAETYARDPKFYGGTFCCGCGAHFPVGAEGEFVWDGTNDRVGT